MNKYYFAKLLKLPLLFVCVLLTACISAEQRQANLEQQRKAMQEVESKMPQLFSVYQKACTEYLSGDPALQYDKVAKLMYADGFEDSPVKFQERGVKTRAVTNLQTGIQVQMDVQSTWKFRCVVLPKRPDVELGGTSRKILRKIAKEHAREFGEQFAAQRQTKLKRSIDGQFHYMGLLLSPLYLFESPVEGRPVALMASRYIHTADQEAGKSGN